MNYVITDLEWNSVFVKKHNMFLNEIIEIGAVKVDEELNILDTFTALVNPKFTRKLTGRVKELTKITNEELEFGQPFSKAIQDFKAWTNLSDCVICTWGNTDIRTLVDNYKLLLKMNTVPFLKRFCDLQLYFQKSMDLDTSQQIGLSKAAELLGIDVESMELHRALSDCMLTLGCIKAVYRSHPLKPYTSLCNDEFYKKLFFKAKVISDIDNKLVDKSQLFGTCPQCGQVLSKDGKWSFKGEYFRCRHFCKSCDLQYIVCVRFKKYYDRVDIKKRIDKIVTDKAPNDETENVNTGTEVN